MNNLSRKEYRDAREVLIGGIAIFWVVPIVLELLFIAIGRERETFPFVWAFLALVGWLYAVVSGAHTVCRDWGKPEEHFLLAMPVSARHVVWAKLKAGAVILFVVLLLAAAWDFTMDRSDMFRGTLWHATDMLAMVRWAILWGWIFAVGYVIGFTTAIVTRQMLASTLVGCLTLLVWLVAPLISSRLQFLHPKWWSTVESVKSSTDSSWLGFGWPFVVLTVLGLVTCVGTTLIGCTRERVIRLGHKQLAWAAALIVLMLLGLALGEVGNSLVVRDQKEIFHNENFWYPRVLVANQGDQFYAVSARPISTPSVSPRHGRVPTIWRLQLASFRLDDRGRIQDLRQADLPNKLNEYGRIVGLAIDENAELVLTMSHTTKRKDSDNDWDTGLLRLRLSWPSHGPLQVISRTTVEPPPDRLPVAPVNVYNDWEGKVSRYAYLQERVSGDVHDVLPKERKLYVFDWSDGPTPQPRYEIQLPPRTYAQIYRGELHFELSNASSNGLRSWTLGRPLDPDHPELLLDKRNWAHDPDALPPTELFLDNPDERSATRRGDLWCVSQPSGLRIIRHSRPHEWELVGEYRASPLALWFRRYGDHQPRFLDDSFVLENGLSQLALYDTSDPAHPRRVGFFQTYDGEVYPTPHFLLLVEGNLLTVLDRPKN
ncbi:MAG TPA: hypothetical protein VNL17_09060 [Verrucomicrobiae bacterium]|nr:hypothetical protein [Verrucomicrobiae bacterium]